MPPVQAIFFDIGDTLVFDAPPLRERLARAARTIGLPLDEARLPLAFRAGEAYAVSRYLKGVAWDDPDSLRQAMARVFAALDLSPLDEETWPHFLAAFAAIPFERYVHSDAIALLNELKRRGFVIGSISDWETTLPDLLAELGIAPFLDALAVSEIVGVTKPHPHLFQEALHQAHVSPEMSLHVGDWYELDVCGARSVGMQALLFDWPGRCPKADCPRVTTFAALTNYLLALPAPDEEPFAHAAASSGPRSLQ